MRTVALRGVGGPNRRQYSFLRFLCSVRPPTGEGRQGKALWEGCDAARGVERGRSDQQSTACGRCAQRSTVPWDVRDEGEQVPLLARGPSALVHRSRFALLSDDALVPGHGSCALLSGACHHGREPYVAYLREPCACLCMAHQLVPYSSVHVPLHDADQDHRLHSVTFAPDSSAHELLHNAERQGHLAHAPDSCDHLPHDAALQDHRLHSVTSVPYSSVHELLHDAELQGHLAHAPDSCAHDAERQDHRLHSVTSVHEPLHDAELQGHLAHVPYSCDHVLLHDAAQDHHPCLAQGLVPSAQRTSALTLPVLQEVLPDDPFALHELLADVLPPGSCLLDLQSLSISLRFANLLQHLDVVHSSVAERHVSLLIVV